MKELRDLAVAGLRHAQHAEEIAARMQHVHRIHVRRAEQHRPEHHAEAPGMRPLQRRDGHRQRTGRQQHRERMLLHSHMRQQRTRAKRQPDRAQHPRAIHQPLSPRSAPQFRARTNQTRDDDRDGIFDGGCEEMRRQQYGERAAERTTERQPQIERRQMTGRRTRAGDRDVTAECEHEDAHQMNGE